MARTLAIAVAVLGSLVACAGGLSAQDREYVDYVKATRVVVGDSLIRFSALTRDPQLADPDWQQAARDELWLWKAAHEDARGRASGLSTDVAELRDAHIEMLALLNEVADDNLVGLDRLDAVRIEAAPAKLGRATALSNRVQSMLDDLD